MRNVAVVATLAILLTGCAAPPVATNYEDEVVSFTLDYIIQTEIGGTADYIRTSGQPWVSAPPQANIIIYAPILKVDDPYIQVDTDTNHPTKVWWFEDNKLIATDDKLDAIDQYHKLYMDKPSPNIWGWGYYTFGIISVSSLGGQAEIYLGASCGPLCGHGFRYTLRRVSPGKWQIIAKQQLWQA